LLALSYDPFTKKRDEGKRRSDDEGEGHAAALCEEAAHVSSGVLQDKYAISPIDPERDRRKAHGRNDSRKQRGDGAPNLTK
jgi:hypothetical protein